MPGKTGAPRRKKRRLDIPTPQSSPPAPAAPSLLKRSRCGTLLSRPFPKQKRRAPSQSPSHPTAKRQRVGRFQIEVEHHDINMIDVDRDQETRPTKRPTGLHQVLRRERAARAMEREVCLWYMEALRGGMSKESVASKGGHGRQNMGGMRSNVADPSSMSGSVADISSMSGSAAEMTGVSGSVEDMSGVRGGGNEHLEEIDVSHSTDHAPTGGPAQPSVQAALLEDGTCLVSIKYADGATQNVVVERPLI